MHLGLGKVFAAFRQQIKASPHLEVLNGNACSLGDLHVNYVGQHHPKLVFEILSVLFWLEAREVRLIKLKNHFSKVLGIEFKTF